MDLDLGNAKDNKKSRGNNVQLTEPEAIWTVISNLSHDVYRSVKIRVFSDSQSALRSIRSPKVNDSLELVLKTREKMRKATYPLHWVPGHVGIRGNERANKLAQHATEDSRPMSKPATEVPISTIYAKATILDFRPKHS